MNDHNLNVNLAILEVAVANLRREIEVEKKNVRTFPNTTQDVEVALMGLLDAENVVNEHFVLYPRTVDTQIYEKSQDCRDHWSMALSQKDSAIRRLLEVARFMKEGENS